MLVTKTIASAALSLIVNDVPVQATLLHGNLSGCEMSAFVAKQWRRAGAVVIEQRVGSWCIAGKVSDGFWHAEQWEAGDLAVNKSRGWLVRIPLNSAKTVGRRSRTTLATPWALTVFDPDISASVRYRQSRANLDEHHRKSLSLSRSDSLVLTRPHPDGGSYSVVIDRGERR